MGGWVGLQKLITDLDMRNGYKGGVRFQISYEVKKRGKLTHSFASPENDFFLFLCCDYMGKNKKKLC